MTDQVDAMVAAWRRERPDLDLGGIALLGRLARLTLVMAPMVEAVFARHGLRQGEFDVLAALRRSGPPYTLTPSELSALLLLSRAGMTNRIDRLEAAGFVRRELDSADRRSFRVALTESGLRAVDGAVTEHAGNVARLMSPLGKAEQATLGRLLRRLLDGVEEV